MISEWLLEPLQYSFMQRAFIGTSLMAVLAGMVGVFIVLKGLAFMGDAIAHTAFSGMAIALVLGWNIYFGAFLMALATALGITFLNRKAKVRHDTALAILFTGAFAVGVILMATMPSFASDLSNLLLGSVLGIRSQELLIISIAVVVVSILLYLAFEHLVFSAFDPVGAEAAGLPVLGLQILMMTLLCVVVVVSLQSVGVILVMALLITPAATAAIYTRKLKTMMLLSGIFGLLAAWIGLYISYYLSAPPGATIVVVATLEFSFSLLGSAIRNKIRLVKHRASIQERQVK